MKEFDIKINGDFEKTPARLLPPPQLRYAQQKIANVAKGVWRADRFQEPSIKISNDNSWTILNLNQRTQDRDLYNVAEMLQKVGGRLGMKIGQAKTPFEHLQWRGNDVRCLRDFFNNNKNLNLVVVIIPVQKGYYSKYRIKKYL